ncbi:MAG: LemA family protein [Bacteroidota bacterium]|nr:LemA family protein [Bacteroidota bacterium]
MKTNFSISKWAIRLLVLGTIPLMLSSCGYNGLVEKREVVDKQWAQVENVYQSRLDLIPNLVRTVERAANFEKSTFVDVTKARAGIDPALASAKSQIQSTDAANLDEDKIAQFQKSQENAASAAGRYINVVFERYPDLKATANYSQLQEDLKGSETRIRVERNKFNTVVGEYNTAIKRFPANLTAGMFGFKSKGYFKMQEGADKAPDVSEYYNDAK